MNGAVSHAEKGIVGNVAPFFLLVIGVVSVWDR
jgi:hypothetical protein